jgi:hypothetical protein
MEPLTWVIISTLYIAIGILVTWKSYHDLDGGIYEVVEVILWPIVVFVILLGILRTLILCKWNSVGKVLRNLRRFG